MAKEDINTADINYKNLALLKRFLTRYGKIRPRYYSGVTIQQQKKIAAAIKKARFMALIPYTR